MNFNVAASKSLLMALVIGMVAPLAAQTPAQPGKPAQPAKPAQPTQPAPTVEAKIEGVVLIRNDGSFLGLTVTGPRLVLKFYDADKKPAPVDLRRVAARWEPVNVKGEVRSILNPNETGDAMVSTSVVKPPLTFRVYLTLFDQDDKVVETLVADLKLLSESRP